MKDWREVGHLWKGHTVELLTVRLSDMLPKRSDRTVRGFGLELPDPLINVWRVDDLRDFELRADAYHWIDSGNAATEKELHDAKD
jgi:hypothetical protein